MLYITKQIPTIPTKPDIIITYTGYFFFLKTSKVTKTETKKKMRVFKLSDRMMRSNTINKSFKQPNTETLKIDIRSSNP